MNVQLDAELVMELRADCPEEDRLVVGGNDWGYLKVIHAVYHACGDRP